MADGPVRPRIACLLPVRNGEDALPAWLDAASTFCDVVVALDDGSTDGTGDLLRAHPMVGTVLANPRREGFLGWHDGVNRNRLLAAASELHPEWILSVDADERIDPTDAAALRAFVDHDAIPGCAYGFRWYRMVDDGHCDPDYEWAFRLFAHRPGHRFPQRRLDFAPVPSSLPRSTWVCTTLRIQHLGDADEAARAARVAKYREADPEGSFRQYYERLAPISAGPFEPWTPRPVDAPVLDDSGTAAGLPLTRDLVAAATVPGVPLVVAMLPARNAAPDLPGWFESVSRFADAVVALDDGSTDDTGAILRAHPLVARLLENPVREGYEGWDDAANRNRLLEAAKGLGAGWVIGIDADERIPVEDGVALRRFIREEARPEHAYGFPVHRMIGDLEHYDRVEMVAYRLFAPQPDDELADLRLHGVPIPSSFDEDALLPTTIRLQHLAGVTAERREGRLAKYDEVDPDREWEPDYGYVRHPVGPVLRWPHRDPSLPVVRWPDGIGQPAGLTVDDLGALDLDGPVLSVAVLDLHPTDGGAAAAALLQDLAREPCAEPVELLCVTASTDAARHVEQVVPGVRIVGALADTTEGSARNAALEVARGDYLTFLAATSPLQDGVLDAVLEAHERGAALVAGTAVPVDRAPATVADRLLDAAGVVGQGSMALPAPCSSFAREALLAAGGFDPDRDAGLEVLATRDLLERDLDATTVPELLIGGAPSVPDLRSLLKVRFEAGRLARRTAGTGPARASARALRATADLARRSAVPAAGALGAPPRRLRALVLAGALATGAGMVVSAWVEEPLPEGDR